MRVTYSYVVRDKRHYIYISEPEGADFTIDNMLWASTHFDEFRIDHIAR